MVSTAKIGCYDKNILLRNLKVYFPDYEIMLLQDTLRDALQVRMEKENKVWAVSFPLLEIVIMDELSVYEFMIDKIKTIVEEQPWGVPKTRWVMERLLDQR